MLNTVILQGRLTHEPEVKNTTSGKDVLNFRIAVQDSYDRNKSYFIDCTAWANNASFISKYFSKGDLILVKGSIHTDPFTDKDGNKRTKFYINVENVEFCGSKSSSTPSAADATPVEEDDDLPF